MGSRFHSDPVKAYLSEIGNVPLLSKEKEIELGTLIQAGLEAQERLDSGDFDLIDHERWLSARVAEGKRAQDKMVEANLRLVVSIAKNHVGRGLLLLDLIQEGNIGLITAAQKFDPDKGHKFSTYATWWIKQAVTRAIANQGRTIRLPVHMVETVNKLKWVQRDLTTELQRDPTMEELTAKLVIVDPKRKWTEEKVREVLKVSQEMLSLDVPVGEDDEGSSLIDFISYEPGPEELVDEEEINYNPWLRNCE